MKRDKLKTGQGPVKLLLVRTGLENYILNAVDPPLGILSLSAMVKQEFPDTVEVRVKDLRIKKENETTFKKDLLEWQPDIVGFSSLSAEAERTAYWTDFAKKTSPEITVIIGGPYVSMFPEESLRETGADVAFMWEAERSLCEWLNCYIGKTPQNEVAGIVLWDENRCPYITAPPELIDDISVLPRPDWDAICFDDYYGSLSMNFINAHRRYTSVYTSRGCPFNCAYCHHTQGKKVRYRNIRQVVDEIEYIYHKHGIREIQIVDDIFNINKERVFEFCRLIKEKKLKIYISFPNGLRGDVLTEAVIDALVDAGAYSMTFAIETATPRLQKLIRKNLNLEKAKDMIRYAYSKGVITRCFFMIGFVTETQEEVQKTIDLALSLPLLHAAFFTVAPQKNTELFEITKKLHPSFNVETGSHYFGNLPNYIDYDLPAMQRKAYMRFFFSPVRMFTYFWRLPRKLQFIRMMLIAFRDVVFRMR